MGRGHCPKGLIMSRTKMPSCFRVSPRMQKVVSASQAAEQSLVDRNRRVSERVVRVVRAVSVGKWPVSLERAKVWKAKERRNRSSFRALGVTLTLEHVVGQSG